SALLLASLQTVALAANCSLSPIYNDIHRRTVHGSDVFQYGSFIGVGLPSQNQSIFVSLKLNETSFASSNFCQHSNLTNCQTSTGGSVDYNQSTTWQPNPSYNSKDFPDVVPSTIHGKDNINLFTHFFETEPASATIVRDTQVAFGESGDVRPGRLGMGSSSTLLNSLVAMGRIAGRTYSLYVGSGMSRAGGVVNGSSVFGGYDAGRFYKPVYANNPLDLSNPDFLHVTVTGITLNDKTNSAIKNISILDKGASFQARITTDQYPMSLPYQVTQNFMSVLSAETTTEIDNSLRLTKPFNGSMTITLSNGFSVTLPHQVVYNNSGLSPVAARSKQDSSPNYLSLAWLSEVYLMIDYDSNVFHMAQVKAKNAYVMPRTFCPKSIPVPYDYSKSSSPFMKQGMIGAVIGGIIGGSAIVIACVALYMWWKRRE
ncbi:hypothetical protein EJ08DRAFT_565208, partial [Tothia fuscella]